LIPPFRKADAARAAGGTDYETRRFRLGFLLSDAWKDSFIHSINIPGRL
jgi:hypothetical protein